MPDCSVCQSDMDMEEFNDERESTETCLKLECGHAFHSRCIIAYMRRTDFDCIQCNRHRTPEARLEEAGLSAQAIEAFKNDPEFRRLRADINRKTVEYKRMRFAVNRKIIAFIKENDGFGITGKHQEITRAIGQLKRYTRTECVKRNPTLMAAITKELSPDGTGHCSEYFFRRRMGIPSQYDLRKSVTITLK